MTAFLFAIRFGTAEMFSDCVGTQPSKHRPMNATAICINILFTQFRINTDSNLQFCFSSHTILVFTRKRILVFYFMCQTYLNLVVHCCSDVPMVLHHVPQPPVHKRLASHDRIQLLWIFRHFASWSRRILCLRFVVNRQCNNKPISMGRERQKKNNANKKSGES